MLDFFRTFFRPAPPSGTTAKERLRLVLLSDHLSLAPDVVDALKRDLLEVISRYVEIDPANADVTFEHREREIAMLASIPITGVRDRERPRAPDPVPPPVSTPALEAESENGVAVAAHDVASLAAAGDSCEEVVPAVVAVPRRRRRKKKAASASSTGANKLAAGST